MATEAIWTVMPDDLANLTAPTRADAEAYLNRGWNRYTPFEETIHGKHCASGLYDADKCKEYRQLYDEKREAAINDAMIGCQREYERKVAQKARIEEQNAEVMAAETATLRQRFLEQPGSTPEEFEKALPELLAERRRRAALDGQSQHERLMDQMRPNISF